jgi:Tfp pilus assembly protein PilZ
VVHLDTQYSSNAIAMRGAAVTNLSRSGLFLKADILDNLGSMVALSLSLPREKKPISIAGRVVRVDTRARQSGMGILFTDLSLKSRQRLARYMEDDHSERLSSVASVN